VVIGEKRLTLQSEDSLLQSIKTQQITPGCQQITTTITYPDLALRISHYTRWYEGTNLIEVWLAIDNQGSEAQPISRVDSVALTLPNEGYELMAYGGSWGWEFEPHRFELGTEAVVLESRSGRSSHGNYPWFALNRGGQGLLSGAVAWSGNWVLRFEPNPSGGYNLSGGLHDWSFGHVLAAGATFVAPAVVLVLSEQTDLNSISDQYSMVGRQFWYPHNQLADALPVEWNHWWSYEDRQINEATFLANVEVAAKMGIEVCTLDAGWFGSTEPDTHWYNTRGDWAAINSERFPSGIRALADAVHTKGMAFGIWCEIEGLGKDARLAETNPELVARRDGERLGYICLGSAANQEWAYRILERLIVEYQADWIKLDFNLDPAAGCNRLDHDHGPDDGIYAHYQGYYQLLSRVRQNYPHVVLENCSSGGLRIDLGIARHTHMAFLSDPDWPEHSLQCFWGASTFLAPEASLHWGYCEWSLTEHRHQHFDPRDPQLQPHQLDYYTRISMLRRFGFSQRLPDLPAWVAERYREHIAVYQRLVKRFIGQGLCTRLTPQPMREGRGERWAAFQYRLIDQHEQLVFAFRLPGGAAQRSLRLADLERDRDYRLIWVGEAHTAEYRGSELLDQGLMLALPEEGSVLIHIVAM
jgi:alpha-galactosidase